MKIDTFITEILDRPAMYCVNNVEDLNLIIWGYLMGLQSKEDNNFMVYFRELTNKHFKSKKDTDWSRLIRFYSASDKHSIELFSQIFIMAKETIEKRDFKKLNL